MIYIGIDIGKYHHEALALDRDGRILSKPIRFANSKTGFDRFNAYLKQFTVSGELSSSCGVKLACEATGHYWMNLYHFLKEEGLLVIVVNPLQTQAQRKAHIRRTKTDTKDALMVAKLLRLGELHVSYVPERQIFYLRELTRFRCGLADTVGDLKRQIIAVLDKVFPEYHTLFSDTFSNISKRGSPYLRRAVYLATIAAIRKDPELAQYFAKKQAQGKHYTMAAMATARKLLARIFVVLKENRPYKIRP